MCCTGGVVMRGAVDVMVVRSGGVWCGDAVLWSMMWCDGAVWLGAVRCRVRSGALRCAAVSAVRWGAVLVVRRV